MGHKVFIIGLDGGTWDLLDPMIERGVMPTLGALKSAGVAGKLTSTIPPITPCAWTTFQTGVRPGRHGIFGFSNFDKRTHELSLVNASAIRFPTLWELASRAGKRVACINVPMTYPPRPVNGVMITGMLTPSDGVQFTYPPDLGEELKSRWGRYDFMQKGMTESLRDNPVEFTDLAIHMVRFRAEVAEWLLQQDDWDLFMVQFQAVDPFQHGMWSYLMDPSRSPEHYRLGIRFYRALDEAIGQVCGAADPLLGIVMSDHGFQHRRRRAFLNTWLLNRDYLVMKEGHASLRLARRLFTMVRRADGLHLRSRLPSGRAQACLRQLDQWSSRVDFGRSRLYATTRTSSPYAFLYASGTRSVGPDVMAATLSRELAATLDPKTGRPFVEWVQSAEALYAADGPTVPDFVVKLRPGYGPSSQFSGKLFEAVRQGGRSALGMHHIDGVVLSWGSSIAKAASLERAHIADICPTVLNVLGVPLPRNLDGKVLRHIFEESPLAAPELENEQVPFSPELPVDSHLSPDEEKEILDRLRDLGYLDD